MVLCLSVGIHYVRRLFVFPKSGKSSLISVSTIPLSGRYEFVFIPIFLILRNAVFFLFHASRRGKTPFLSIFAFPTGGKCHFQRFSTFPLPGNVIFVDFLLSPPGGKHRFHRFLTFPLLGNIIFIDFQLSPQWEKLFQKTFLNK